MLLVDAGASLEARDTSGRTPLHSAATKLDVDPLEALLRKALL
jgi:ankyrin repeat protein